MSKHLEVEKEQNLNYIFSLKTWRKLTYRLYNQMALRERLSPDKHLTADQWRLLHETSGTISSWSLWWTRIHNITKHERRSVSLWARNSIIFTAYLGMTHIQTGNWNLHRTLEWEERSIRPLGRRSNFFFYTTSKQNCMQKSWGIS